MKTKRLFSRTAKCNEQRKTMNVKNQPSALSQRPYATYVDFISDNVQHRLNNICTAASTETILETKYATRDVTMFKNSNVTKH